MVNRATRLQARILALIMEELAGYLSDLQGGTFSPSLETVLAQFVRKLGIDASQFSGIAGRESGLDPYRVLGLEATAADEEIKKRYHELLHKLHPDTAGTPGTGFLLQMVVAAYELIKRERNWS